MAVYIYCKSCNHTFSKGEVTGGMDVGDDPCLKIEPCPVCLAEARKGAMPEGAIGAAMLGIDRRLKDLADHVDLNINKRLNIVELNLAEAEAQAEEDASRG